MPRPLQLWNVRMAVHDQTRATGSREGPVRNGLQSRSSIARASLAAGMGTRERDPGAEIRVQPGEGPDGPWVAQHGAQLAIPRILGLAKPVSMGKERRPAADLSLPWVQRVAGTCFRLQDLAAPAIVIPTDPEHRHPGLVQIGQRGQHAETRTGHHVPPGEPEVEQVAHDDQRPCLRRQVPEQAKQRLLRFRGGDTKVHVADHKTGGGKHVGSLTPRGVPHKPPPTGAAGPPGRHLSGMTFETVSELRVRYAETDQMGVVYHANYLIWCEIGRTDFIRRAGRSYADLERDGVRLAVSEASLRFRASARYDDPIRVHTTLQALGSRGMTFGYRIIRGDTDTVLVTATTALVSIDSSGKPSRLPDDVRGWLERAQQGGGLS
jgi:acyl-CoA thioester hydrolase